MSWLERHPDTTSLPPTSGWLQQVERVFDLTGAAPPRRVPGVAAHGKAATDCINTRNENAAPFSTTDAGTILGHRQIAASRVRTLVWDITIV